MPRVKRGRVRQTKRKRLLKQTKGYHWNRKNTVKAAKTAIRKAGQSSFRGRRQKKQFNRNLWNIKINAACRQNGTTYSRFIKGLKDNKIELDRKVLAELAVKAPAAFAKVVEQVKK